MNAHATAGAPNRVLAALRLLRPHQWVKNGFVLLGVLFGHAWDEPVRVQAALYAFAAFCATASAVYVVNDWFDRERDRLHPRKRLRPIASGQVGGALALALTVAAAFAVAPEDALDDCREFAEYLMAQRLVEEGMP